MLGLHVNLTNYHSHQQQPQLPAHRAATQRASQVGGVFDNPASHDFYPRVVSVVDVLYGMQGALQGSEPLGLCPLRPLAITTHHRTIPGKLSEIVLLCRHVHISGLPARPSAIDLVVEPHNAPNILPSIFAVTRSCTGCCFICAQESGIQMLNGDGVEWMFADDSQKQQSNGTIALQNGVLLSPRESAVDILGYPSRWLRAMLARPAKSGLVQSVPVSLRAAIRHISPIELPPLSWPHYVIVNPTTYGHPPMPHAHPPPTTPTTTHTMPPAPRPSQASAPTAPRFIASAALRAFRHESQLSWRAFNHLWMEITNVLNSPSHDILLAAHRSHEPAFVAKLSELTLDMMNSGVFAPAMQAKWQWGHHQNEEDHDA